VRSRGKLITGLVFVLSFYIKAQMSGLYNVPGSFPTLAAAISSLNSVGVNGPTTINIATGYSETAPVNGFILSANGTSVDPIVFQKIGAGSNPILYAYSGGTAIPTSTLQDGVFRLLGCDYITIDGIDISDNNIANPATMEFGYGLFVTSGTNGCQNNLIKNCTIKLNRVNSYTGNWPCANGSRGIEAAAATYTAHTTIVSPTSFAGTNSNNSFYNNTIDNCYTGISLQGHNASNFTLASVNNNVGGSSAVTGNKIFNFGGIPSASCEAIGIDVKHQWNLNISNNYVNNNNGNGFSHPYIINGVLLDNSSLANSTVDNNTITLQTSIPSAGTHSFGAIVNLSGSSPNSTSTVEIANNIIKDCIQTNTNTFGPGHFYGIFNITDVGYLNILNNRFENNSFSATTGSTTCIHKSGAMPQVTNISYNEFTKIQSTYSNSSMSIKCIDCPAGSNNNIQTGTLSITGNTLHALTFTMPVNGWLYFICTNAPTKEKQYNSNIMDSIFSVSQGNIYGIQCNTGTQTFVVTNNRFTNITKTVTGNNLIGIDISNTTTLSNVTTVSNNYFANASCTGSTVLTGISVSTGSTQLMSVCNNTIMSISNPSATAGGYSGILAGGGAAGSVVSGNLVKGGWGFGGGGISISNNFPLNLSVFSNTVANLQGSLGVTGVVVSLAYQLDFYRNRIFDIESNDNTGNAIIYGVNLIQLQGNANIYNNLIGDLRCPSCVGNEVINGVKLTGFNPNTKFNVFYNTIYLNATSTGSLFSAVGIYPVTISTNSTLATHVIRNNIIVNRSIPTGNGINQAIHRYMFTLENYDVTSNNNLLYPGNTGTSCSTFYANNIDLAGSIPYITPREVNSFQEDPTFISTNGNHPFFLMPSSNVPTQIESGGIPIPTIIDDYAGTIRNTSTPDVGAWEGFYAFADSISPTITSFQVNSGPCNLSGLTLTANIVDPSGVPTNSLAPRCYFKINNNPYNSVAGTLTSGTSTNGIWNFALNYAAAPGNILSYFITAQDNVNPTNIGSLPTPSFAALNVNSVTTYPASCYTLSIIGVLNGTYSVGTTGNFTTLTSAAAAYNTWCIAGPVTFLLTDPIYSTSEMFPVTFSRTPYASTTNSLLIRPANGVNAVITGSSNSVALLKFHNAKCIDLDGINAAGTSLRAVNTNTGNSSVFWLASTSSISLPGNKRIGIKNLILEGGNNQQSTNNGIVSGQDMTWPITGGGADNDSVTIISNTILSVYYGITGGGTSSLTTGGIDNWIIKNNVIGPAITGTSAIGAIGITIGLANTFIIQDNLIRHVEANNINSFGMRIEGNTGNFIVSGNTLTALSSSAITSGTNSIAGIIVSYGNSNIRIENNYISNVSNTSPSGYYGARGITLRASGSSTNVLVQNNMISDIYSKAGNTPDFMPIGICIEGGSGYEINNNSVHLATNYSGYIGFCSSSALAITSVGSNVKIRNNIFSNYYDNTNSFQDITYAIYSLVNTSGVNIDYNDYMVGGGASTLVLGYNNPTNLYTLANIQTGFGGNLNSQNVAPVFTSTNDLHLVTSSNPLLDNLALPIYFVTNDFDGQPRNASTPDIGADEFYSFACSGANSTVTSATTFTACAGQTLQLSATAGSGGGLAYQWKVSTVSNGPYSNVLGGTGANTPTYASGPLGPGNYYFVMETTCVSASVTAVSNEVTVTINPIPTITISNSSSVCLNGNCVLNASSNIATQFNWAGPASFTSSVQNPTLVNVQLSMTGIYFVTVQQAGCINTGSTTLNIVVPTLSISNAGPSCSGYTVQLNATSANSYSWQGPNSFSSNAQNPILAAASASSAGIYTLTASISSCTTSVTTTVSIAASPTAIASNNSSICAGQDLIFSGGGGYVYAWSGPFSYTSAAQNPTISNVSSNASGVYTLQVSNAQFCSSNATTTATVYASPIISVQTSNTLVCIGSPVTLTANGASTFTWNSSIVGNSISVSPSVNTTFTVSGTDANGCENASVFTQSVSTCLGIEETISANGVWNIFPNPNHGKMTFISELPLLGSYLEILDNLGRRVINMKIYSVQFDLSLDGIEKGIYYLHVFGKSENSYKKFILQ
jgi:hypothetical protein